MMLNRPTYLQRMRDIKPARSIWLRPIYLRRIHAPQWAWRKMDMTQEVA